MNARRIMTGLVAAAVIAGVVGLPACRRGNDTAQVVAAGEATEQEIIDLTNQFRTQEGLPPLRKNETLMTAARDHAWNMAVEENLTHLLHGKDPGTRLKEFGYEWTWCGENIAWNQRSSEAALQAWKDSPGHRANLLTRKGDEFGVGIVYSRAGEPYYCQLFGKGN